MEKTLGQDIKDLDQRKAFLIDNTDEVVEKTYTKNFDAEQLADKKTRLAEVSIKINDFENEIKDFKAEIGLQMKPLKEERSSLLDAISAVEDVRDKKIDDELDRIREIAPEIPILEV